MTLLHSSFDAGILHKHQPPPPLFFSSPSLPPQSPPSPLSTLSLPPLLLSHPSSRLSCLRGESHATTPTDPPANMQPSSPQALHAGPAASARSSVITSSHARTASSATMPSSAHTNPTGRLLRVNSSSNSSSNSSNISNNSNTAPPLHRQPQPCPRPRAHRPACCLPVARNVAVRLAVARAGGPQVSSPQATPFGVGSSQL